MPIDKSTEEDYLNGRTFAQGYFLRINAARADAARATPKCKNGVSYSCGKSCISLKKNCRSEPQDEKGKQILKAVKSKASEFAKTKAKTPKATPVKPTEIKPTEIKPDVETPPPPQGDIKVKASKSKTKVSKPVAVEAEKKATPAKTKKAKPSTNLSEVSKEQKKVEAIAKPSKTIGDGAHEGTPKNAKEYYDMATKAGKMVTIKEAQETVDAIVDWSNNSDGIRNDQKAGKFNQQSEHFSNYIKNSTPYDGEIYRGIAFPSEKEAMDWAKGEGHIIDNQSAHSSWTSDIDVAELFALDRGGDVGQAVIIKTINKTGASIQGVAESILGFKTMEVVVSKDARHRVKSVEREAYYGFITVEVEEV